MITFQSTKSEIAVPVLLGETVPGTIDVESERANAFTSHDVRFYRIEPELPASFGRGMKLTVHID